MVKIKMPTALLYSSSSSLASITFRTRMLSDTGRLSRRKNKFMPMMVKETWYSFFMLTLLPLSLIFLSALIDLRGSFETSPGSGPSTCKLDCRRMAAEMLAISLLV